MRVDTGEDTCFYLSFVYVSHSTNKGISMDIMQKVVKSR